MNLFKSYQIYLNRFYLPNLTESLQSFLDRSPSYWNLRNLTNLLNIHEPVLECPLVFFALRLFMQTYFTIPDKILSGLNFSIPALQRCMRDSILKKFLVFRVHEIVNETNFRCSIDEIKWGGALKRIVTILVVKAKPTKERPEKGLGYYLASFEHKWVLRLVTSDFEFVRLGSLKIKTELSINIKSQLSTGNL